MKIRSWLSSVVLALALVGAGSSFASAQSTDVTLKVAVLPIVDIAPLYLGMEKGFFRDEHLTIVPQNAQGGGAVAADVISGDAQVGYSNVVSMILAAAHGLPLQAVTNGSESITDSRHQNGLLMVAAGGPIRTLHDFEGKTLGLNALNTMTEIMIKEVLERHGVDVATIKFVEVPNAELASALKAGRIDLAMETEPFLTAGKTEDARPMLEPTHEYAKKVTLGTYFTTRQYALDHPDIVARFKRAMLKSLVYTAANPAEARRIVPTYTKIDAAVAAKMALVGWSTEIDMPSIIALQKSMIKYGLLTNEVDLKALFPAAAITGR